MITIANAEGCLGVLLQELLNLLDAVDPSAAARLLYQRKGEFEMHALA